MNFNTVNKYITLASLYCKFRQILFCCSVKLFFCSQGGVIYPSVGPFQESKYLSFCYQYACPYEVIPAQNIVTVLPNPLPSDNEKLPCISNPIPHPECLYLSSSVFFTNLTVPNKEFPGVKLLLCLNDHKFIS